MATKKSSVTLSKRELDPLWFKDAIIYELHVRAFADSDGDGIGDFAGLTSKLDYLQDLGVTAIWLLPFYPSPLRDDGYDIADYNEVNPSYGTIQDVKNFIRETHRRGMMVITELVCNHTSDQHPWFQRARRAKPGSAARDFYVWSDTPDKYQDARIIFKDFETSNWTWDAVAGAYFWHRFYSHQPDLNFENPAVHKAIFKAMEFWLDMGVDGMRLDAIPYLYEEEGTNCENLPRTHEFLKKLRRHMDEKYRGRMFLAEANQWPEDSVEYFGDGDECHMAFNFPVMPRLYMGLHMEDRYPIIEIMRQTPPIPENAQWATFLRNHDELTLEMVTDEERDYMYRVYARDRQARINLGIRRRLAPLLGNHRRKIELMNGLLFALPGTPVLYYGDEIGMGDNIYLGDRNGVRTPMQWNGDRNAGFSRANPQKLYLPTITDPEYHYEMVNVENQSSNLHSLLWWMKRLIALRKRYQAFGRGTLEFLHPENRRVLCFLRQHEEETILVVANLSRFVQAVELDLSAYEGMIPIEMFGEIEFPAVNDRPYFITIGPHSFYWFRLSRESAAGGRPNAPSSSNDLTMIDINSNDWTAVLANGPRNEFERLLPNYMRPRRWFGSKARKMKALSLREIASLPLATQGEAKLTLVDVTYTEGAAESYLIPLAYAGGLAAERLLRDWRYSVIARVRLANGEEGVLYEPLIDREFCAALLDLIVGKRRLRGERGSFVGTPLKALRAGLGKTDPASLEPTVVRAEQSNSSIIYGGKFILKLYRRIDNGINPDLEIGQLFSEHGRFANTPPTAGMIEYQQGKEEPATLAILQNFVPNDGDAWDYTLDSLRPYMDIAQTSSEVQLSLPATGLAAMLKRTEAELPAEVEERIGFYLDSASLLGQRTAEMHLALTKDLDSPAFQPEPFSTLYQRSVYQGLLSSSGQILPLLKKQLNSLPESVRGEAEAILARQSQLDQRFQRITKRKIEATRTRHHSDYHLGQVLYTGNDFMIIDFEGEPQRPLSERRIKRSPLRDVAGMLRSFQYAAFTVLFERSSSRPEEAARLREWADYWYAWVGSTFLRSYLQTVGNADFIPADREDLVILLETFLLEKAIYEIGYELNNRPTWLTIPLNGILSILES